jgi:hypothetical protein
MNSGLVTEWEAALRALFTPLAEEKAANFHCHSRESGNPEPQALFYVALDPRFRGDD